MHIEGDLCVDSTTIERITDKGRERPDEGRAALGLSILWCRDEPKRIGETALFAGGGPGAAWIVGRGDRVPPHGPRPAVWMQRRPGAATQRQPLGGATLSRRQLVVEVERAVLNVQNIGRAPMQRKGVQHGQLTLEAGDVFALRGQLVLMVVERPLEWAPLASFPADRAGSFGGPDGFGMVGESPAMWAARESVAFAAARDLHALLLGESGTGKELAARAIHALSERRRGALVARNAATIPAGIADAEIFGNLRDYPNPGMRERPGLIGEADGGTLFLDELGELPSELQSHLLRVLDGGGEYHRLGEAKARRADIRLLGATNRAKDELKQDLLARLSLQIEMPGLNEHREDVALLMHHMALSIAAGDKELAARFFDEGVDGELSPRFSADLVEALSSHRYTLHARELESLLWRAFAGSRGRRIELPPDLSADLRAGPVARHRDVATVSREEIEASLQRHGGNQTRAATELGLKNRWALRRLMQKHGLLGSSSDG